MGIPQEKMAEFARLLDQQTPKEGICATGVESIYNVRRSEPLHRKPTVYPPIVVIAGQGRNRGYLEGKSYFYGVGHYLTLFLPMPIETELIDASPEEPFLAAHIRIDLNRLAELLLRMDRIEPASAKPGVGNTSGIFSAPLHENLLDPAIRLLKCLNNPGDAAILGESIVVEIYFRILNDEQGSSLRFLLQQRGQIQQVSRAVESIHQNLEESVSVEKLAEMSNMSSSGFHKKFKDVMHLSPLQYAKSVKLIRAQTFIREGKSASEAGYLVGYNSPAQFSREYNRHFGFSPSAT
jgi:AraC-like DNA-binding protein